MVLLARGDVLCGWGGMVAAPGRGPYHTIPRRKSKPRIPHSWRRRRRPQDQCHAALLSCVRRTHRTAASDAALGGCAAADPPLGVDRRDGDATASATGVAAHQKSEYGSNFGWSASRHSDVDVSAQVMAANRGEIAIRIFRAATEVRCCSASASRRLSALPTPAPRKRRPGSPSAPLPRLLRWTSRRSPSTPRRTLTRCTGAMFRCAEGPLCPISPLPSLEEGPRRTRPFWWGRTSRLSAHTCRRRRLCRSQRLAESRDQDERAESREQTLGCRLAQENNVDAIHPGARQDQAPAWVDSFRFTAVFSFQATAS